MLENYKDIMTVNELQQVLCIGRSKSYELIRNQEIPSFRIGNAVRIPKQSVIDYITGKCYNIHAVGECAQSMEVVS